MKNQAWLFEPPQAEAKRKQQFPPRNPIWTGCKAKLIERYLFYFVQITFHGTYIDAFAGPQEPDKHHMWAAKLVVESRPRWFNNFFFFELDKAKVGALKKMWKDQPPHVPEKRERKRSGHFYSGNFNANLAKMLKQHPVKDKEATFCLLDQRTFECDWASVEAVAKHKTGGNKIELFYFFPEGWLNRSVTAVKNDKEARMEKWWGDSTWPALLDMHTVKRANHVCAHFKSKLGYKHVHPFPIYEKKDEGGRIMYYMVHASDHDAAPLLMNRAYGKALDIKERHKQLDFLQKMPCGDPN